MQRIPTMWVDSGGEPAERSVSFDAEVSRVWKPWCPGGGLCCGGRSEAVTLCNLCIAPMPADRGPAMVGLP
ncbi:MAG: hypothetical protein QOJ16_2711 [Acidobacteriota bacterium]|jgi:hypothetical protein|nr:hypothetical protein [Acidobacteriota bacterium]